MPIICFILSICDYIYFFDLVQSKEYWHRTRIITSMVDSSAGFYRYLLLRFHRKTVYDFLSSIDANDLQTIADRHYCNGLYYPSYYVALRLYLQAYPNDIDMAQSMILSKFHQKPDVSILFNFGRICASIINSKCKIFYYLDKFGAEQEIVELYKCYDKDEQIKKIGEVLKIDEIAKQRGISL